MFGIDYTAEVWVKTPRADGVDWRALEWQSRAIYAELWRKVGRDGRAELGRLGLESSVAVLTEIPRPVVVEFLPPLLELGRVVVDGGQVFLPDRLACEEAKLSDAAKKRHQRDRERHQRGQNVPDASPDVPDASPEVPPESPAVDNASPAVTGNQTNVTGGDPDQKDQRDLSLPSVERGETPSLRSGVPLDDAAASSRATRRARKSTPPKPDADRGALDPRALDALGAIEADPSLAPIVTRPAQLAIDLAKMAPGVDLTRAIAAAGSWLRENPSRAKSNGNRYLGIWLRRAQERLPGPSNVARLPFAPPEPVRPPMGAQPYRAPRPPGFAPPGPRPVPANVVPAAPHNPPALALVPAAKKEPAE